MLICNSNCSSRLRELISRFRGVRLASLEDAHALADFINETSMSTGRLAVGFTRGKDYFSLLRLQSEKFAALVCEEDGRIVGVGAFTLKKSFVRGQKIWVGYLQDLRVSAAAPLKTRQNFYSCFAEFLKESPSLEDFEFCSLFTTAILDGNKAAQASLSRNNFPLEYLRLTHYTAHVWPKNPMLLGWLRDKDTFDNSFLPELREFYSAQLGRLAFDFTVDDLDRLMSHSSPVFLRENGKIIAACMLVQTDHERRIVAEVKRVNLRFELGGTFITALRTDKNLALQKAVEAKSRLLSLALRKSQRMPGLFTGFIEVDEDPLRMSPWLPRLGYQARGSLYRVFHPEHGKLPRFTDGFLRPIHTPCFEWISS